ncbi:MAG: DUF1295 domain-containing protein [Muribaculaceae bacterium]|nr:DUF1295 domain-containing protein [Muribaculaceae bacterium]
MAVLAVIVFIALHRITAGYGMMGNRKWGPTVNNRLGWFIMELPAFASMVILWAFSPRHDAAAPCVFASLFLLHYFQRTFIFPFLIRGKNRMPWAIILMGLVFNTINAYLIGGWIFYISPESLYQPSWLLSPLFFLGTFIFFTGMGINLYSDHVIRSLRAPGDSAHYIPNKGFYKYVASANYFGETVEWVGFAILTWSLPGLVFAMWTFANLAPRARAIHKKYCDEFGEKYSSLNRRFIIPFLY